MKKDDIFELKKTGQGWLLKYRDHKTGNIDEMPFSTKKEAEDFIGEFGTNPEGCSAQTMFMVVNGSWGAAELAEAGHIPTKITIKAMKSSKMVPKPKAFGRGMGSPNKPTSEDKFHFARRSVKEFGLTRIFSKPKQMDVLFNFLMDDPDLSDLVADGHVLVKTLNTQNRKTKQQCVWARRPAGDGTERMILELIKVDGKRYCDIPRNEVIGAAGGMYEAPCRKKPFEKSRKDVKLLCEWAVKNGDVNTDGYEEVDS